MVVSLIKHTEEVYILGYYFYAHTLGDSYRTICCQWVRWETLYSLSTNEVSLLFKFP